MTPELIAAILGSGGLAYIIPKAIDGFKAWRTGQAAEERKENRSALIRMATAEKERDNEIQSRIMFQEYASRLRRLLIEFGFPEERLPPWPIRDTVKK